MLTPVRKPCLCCIKSHTIRVKRQAQLLHVFPIMYISKNSRDIMALFLPTFYSPLLSCCITHFPLPQSCIFFFHCSPWYTERLSEIQLEQSYFYSTTGFPFLEDNKELFRNKTAWSPFPGEECFNTHLQDSLSNFNPQKRRPNQNTTETWQIVFTKK